jgi:hypothetical protein
MLVRRAPVVLALATLTGVAACRVEHAASGRPVGAVVGLPPAADSAASAEISSALRLYYARLSRRDVKVLSRSFWPGATVAIIMRTRTDSTERVRAVPIEDLANRGRAAKDCPVSFSDEMGSATIVAYGPLAEAWVTYRARCGVTRDSAVTHYGVDAFLLMRHHGRWRIASLAFTHELRSQPLAHAP